MGPIKNYREEERACVTTSAKFNYFSWGPATYFFPQHIVEGLLNSRRRVSDRPSWILIFKTPARKPTNIIVVFSFVPRTRRTPRASSVVTRAGSGDTRAGSGDTIPESEENICSNLEVESSKNSKIDSP